MWSEFHCQFLKAGLSCGFGQLENEQHEFDERFFSAGQDVVEYHTS